MLKMENNLKMNPKHDLYAQGNILLLCGFCVLALPLMCSCYAVQIVVGLLF
jgi:hypothetical protein